MTSIKPLNYSSVANNNDSKGVFSIMNSQIYRVMLPQNHNMDIIYEIGCQESYTGFWTTSFNEAINILDYVSNSYFLDTEKECENFIVTTPYSNVVLEKDYTLLKSDHNLLFDKNEVFVREILDKKLIQIIEKHLLI